MVHQATKSAKQKIMNVEVRENHQRLPITWEKWQIQHFYLFSMCCVGFANIDVHSTIFPKIDTRSTSVREKVRLRERFEIVSLPQAQKKSWGTVKNPGRWRVPYRMFVQRGDLAKTISKLMKRY